MINPEIQAIKAIGKQDDNIADLKSKIRDLQIKLYSVDTVLNNWFTERFKEVKFQPINVTVDEVNSLMDSLGFEYIETVMKFKVEVEYTGTGTVYVTADSEEEARVMVENGEFDLDFRGDFDDSDFSNWGMQIQILDIQDSDH
jgi:hypothetical protein